MTQPIFYHGTRKNVAYSIMQQGFKVSEETSGRNLRAGLYLTPRLDFAALWGPIVIRLRLVAGTRILWHTPIDPHAIRSLKKEFGAGIVKPKFTDLIPAQQAAHQVGSGALVELLDSPLLFGTALSPTRLFLPIGGPFSIHLQTPQTTWL